MRESKFIQLNGSRTFVEFDGNDDGPVIIMLHGLGASSNYFQPLLAPFSSKFRIIRLDWQGLGRTGVDPSRTKPITMPGYVDDIEALMNAASVDKAVLVGHSLGSVAAMHFAAKFPSRVLALVAIGPGKSRAKIPAAKAFTLGMAKQARELGMPSMADGTVAKNVAPSSSDVVRAFVREVVAGQDGEGYAQVCEAMCDDSHVDPEYSAIQCPAVVIAGDQDLISSMEQCKDIQELIGGKEKEVPLKVVHSGHQQVLEDTAGVVEGIELVLAQAGL